MKSLVFKKIRLTFNLLIQVLVYTWGVILGFIFFLKKTACLLTLIRPKNGRWRKHHLFSTKESRHCIPKKKALCPAGYSTRQNQTKKLREEKHWPRKLLHVRKSNRVSQCSQSIHFIFFYRKQSVPKFFS